VQAHQALLVTRDYGLTIGGNVVPPDDMDAAARASLTSTSYARLKQRIGDRNPTARELAFEAEYEREGRYPGEPVDVTTALHANLQLAYERYLLAAACVVLADRSVFSPTPQQVCEIVEQLRNAARESRPLAS
jgi:hypothetical protein